MTGRKLSNRNLSKLVTNKKISLEDIPMKTMRVTIYALRWVFLLIFVFIMIGIIALFLTGGDNHIKNIIGYSITGFFTFFMGYFGWILAQGVIDILSGKQQESVNEFSYYVRKDSKRHRH
jgi:drug/metabolite transporter (DMT)-like permease